MLALGASIGGLVTALAGRNVAFVVNALSFFASAFFIAQTRYDATPAAAPRPEGILALTGITDLVEGVRYVRQRSHVAALMFVKAGWGLAGGVLLLLTIFGQRVFPLAGGSAAGIGVLYGARGIGAGLGPIALRWILGQQPRRLRRAIGPAYFMVGVFYVALAWAPTLWVAALCVLLRAFRRVDPLGVQHGAAADGGAGSLSRPRLRHRARARHADVVGVELLDRPRSSIAPAGRRERSPSCSALMFCVPGVLWLIIQSRWQERPTEPAGPIARQDHRRRGSAREPDRLELDF